MLILYILKYASTYFFLQNQFSNILSKQFSISHFANLPTNYLYCLVLHSLPREQGKTTPFDLLQRS